jgi:hypothetical protein
MTHGACEIAMCFVGSKIMSFATIVMATVITNVVVINVTNDI